MNDRTEPQDERALEELLEQYVLGRLSPDDRAALEERIAADPTLRKALSRERDILEGVRRLGREELKRRLAVATRTLPHPAIPWGRIAALAAVIVIVTGIALWQRWFFPPPPDQTVLEPRATLRESVPAEALELDRATSQNEVASQPQPTAAPAPPPSIVSETSRQPRESSRPGARTYASSGIIVRYGGAEGLAGTRMKSDAVGRRQTERATLEAMKEEREYPEDNRHYRVEIISDSETALPTDEATSGAPGPVRFLVRVLPDSVVIGLPRHILGPGDHRMSDARVRRVSRDSVIIELEGVQIRGFLPDPSLP